VLWKDKSHKILNKPGQGIALEALGSVWELLLRNANDNWESQGPSESNYEM